MTYCKHFFVLLIAIICCSTGHTQVDTSFWFAAPAITPGHENKPIVVRMATYSQAADIVISQPANASFIPYTTHLNSNSAITIDLTNQIDLIENKPGNTIKNYGLKITATANISAYYEA
ncbi:MAG: hypothetical protein H7101_10240, partial [Deinococcales bacterium]|nr:hypothetical protein [Chitinophagaceae bacterium]